VLWLPREFKVGISCTAIHTYSVYKIMFTRRDIYTANRTIILGFATVLHMKMQLVSVGFAAIHARCGIVPGRGGKGMPVSRVADRTAYGTDGILRTRFLCEAVRQCLRTGLVATGANTAVCAGDVLIVVAERFTVCLFTSGADLRLFAGSLCKTVRQCLRTFLITTRANAAVRAGDILVIVTERFTVCLFTGRAGLRLLTGGLCPVVTKRFTVCFLTQ